MKKQRLSFKSALRGIINTVKSESHFRFHIVAAFYVILFSSFYPFTLSQRALLILLITAVMAAEMINTGIEELCNLTADRFEPLVKAAKDAAAGAVFVFAAAAVVIGVLFFWNTEVFAEIFDFFAGNPLCLVLLVLSAVLSFVFVWLGPVGIKAFFLRIKLKFKNKR